MLIMDFTVEEINLIAIDKADTAEKTLARIAAALPDMGEEIITIAEGAARKLSALTEPEYSALSFAPADEMDEGGAYE
jgi:hypothetical protein